MSLCQSTVKPCYWESLLHKIYVIHAPAYVPHIIGLSHWVQCISKPLHFLTKGLMHHSHGCTYYPHKLCNCSQFLADNPSSAHEMLSKRRYNYTLHKPGSHYLLFLMQLEAKLSTSQAFGMPATKLWKSWILEILLAILNFNTFTVVANVFVAMPLLSLEGTTCVMLVTLFITSGDYMP